MMRFAALLRASARLVTVLLVRRPDEHYSAPLLACHLSPSTEPSL